jgi:poly(hydroxyalkanoate) depolymerase family esterase
MPSTPDAPGLIGGLKKLLTRLAALLRRARPAPGRYALHLKAWREYLLYVPKAQQRRALVVWLHGCRQDPETFAAGTRIARHADERGLIVLLPRQSRLANSERCWNWFDPRTGAGRGETAIVAAQTQDVMQKFGIDPRRVYLAGLSAGGALAATLALRRPELFAAAAFHSAVPAGAATDAHDAQRVMAEGPRDNRTDVIGAEARAAAGKKARLPVLVIQGSADATVAPVNATFVVRQFLLFNGETDLPAGAALPPSHTRVVHPRGGGYIEGEFYAGRRLAARLLTIPGLGHAWSGGDPAHGYFDDGHLDATAAILDFFASRP